MRYRPLLLALSLCAAAHAAGPQLDVALDSSIVHLGDPLRLRMQVERDGTSRTLYPDLDEVFAPLSLRSSSRVLTTDLGAGRERDERVYELAVFDPEIDRVPSVTVRVVTAAGDTVRLASEPLPVEVVSVRDPEEGDELRAIKPPVEILGGIPLWLAGVLAAVVAVCLAWLANRFLRRDDDVARTPTPPPTAPVDYEREFARIADMGLLERGAVKLYYTRLSDVMRRYLEERLTVDALERTTAEIAADLGYRLPPPDPDSLRDIVRFLQEADLVKFARAEPSEEVARQAPECGRQAVVDVDRQLAAARTAIANTDPVAVAVERG